MLEASDTDGSDGMSESAEGGLYRWSMGRRGLSTSSTGPCGNSSATGGWENIWGRGKSRV